VRPIAETSLACLCGLLWIGPTRVGAQEKPVPPDAIGKEPEVSLFDESPERKLLITGFGVATYTYDFNTDHNSFDNSALAVAFSKVISNHFSIFAQLTASREEPSAFLSDQSETDIKTDIDNLQVTWNPSATSGLAITIGKFDSPLAIERDDAPLNFQATNSFTFQFARPVKFTGIEVYDAVSPSVDVWAILTNGWDVDRDNNKAKTVAVYGLWSPSLAAHVGLGGIYGAEKDNRTGDPRATAIATLLFQPAANWVFGGEGVFGREPHSAEDGGTAEWYAAMIFTHYRFAHDWGVTLRGDSMDDRGGSRTGQRQVLTSATLSPQYLVGAGFFGIFRYLDRTTLKLPEVSVRLDLRYDHSSEPVFKSAVAGVGKRDHFSATLQTVFLF
jgi:hypothetical protein